MSSSPPPLVSLHIVRHFETHENRLGILQGQSIDNCLTSLGLAGAISMGASWLSSHLPSSSPSSPHISASSPSSSPNSSASSLSTDVGWDEVLVSPMRRTRETMSGLLSGLGSERFGCRCDLCRPLPPPSAPEDEPRGRPASAGEEPAPPPSLPSTSQTCSLPQATTPACLVDSLRAFVRYDARLMERAHGALEGRRTGMSLSEALELHAKEQQQQQELQQIDSGGGTAFHPLEPPKFETQSEVDDRLRQVVRDIVSRARLARSSRDVDGLREWKVLLLTHGGVVRSLLKNVAGVTRERVKALNGSVSVVNVHEEEGGGGGVTYELVGGVGDTSHLPVELVTTRTEW